MNGKPHQSGEMTPVAIDPWFREQCSRTHTIVLCFGDRGAFLEPIVNRLLEIGVGHILLVTNAVTEKTAEIADGLCRQHESVSREDLPENGGSAGGYARGLRTASRSGQQYQYFWLLDDDNLPEPDCLLHLLDAYRLKRSEEQSAGPVMVAARPDQGIHIRRLMAGTSWKTLAPRPSSFLGFHWRRLPRYLAALVRMNTADCQRDEHSSASDYPVVQVGHTYYGGMLLPRSIVSRAGYPDERFFLYADDTEYSIRITSHTAIYLVGSAIIHDLDVPWYAREGANRFVQMLAGEAGRVYYIVRNSVWIDCYLRKQSTLQYWLHRQMVLMLFRYYVWKGHGSRKQLETIRQAIRDGEENRLGRNEQWCFDDMTKGRSSQ